MQLPPWPGNVLTTILEGKESSLSNEALIDHDDDRLGLRLRTIITDRYRLTWFARKPFGELFDLQEDPQEMHNLWDDPGYSSVRDELTAHLLDQVIMSDSRLPRPLSGA
jgi:uncharacterized sulfatase